MLRADRKMRMLPLCHALSQRCAVPTGQRVWYANAYASSSLLNLHAGILGIHSYILTTFAARDRAMARKAKACAEVLIQMYADHKNHFLLTKKEFKDIAGKGKMRTKYLMAVDARLRKQGYVLIDVHKERQMIGVVDIETITQWDIPAMPHDTHDHQLSEEQDDKHESQENSSNLDTSFSTAV